MRSIIAHARERVNTHVYGHVYGNISQRVCTHKNCRFGEVSFLAPVYKSSRISATQRPIRNKFGTNVEKGRLVRNPQKNGNFLCRLMVPFRVDGHIFVKYFIYIYIIIYIYIYYIYIYFLVCVCFMVLSLLCFFASSV